ASHPLDEPGSGTHATCRDEAPRSVFGGNADIEPTSPNDRIWTHCGHRPDRNPAVSIDSHTSQSCSRNGAINPGRKQTMLRSFDTSVLIVGAGPVGLTLAMELASRGVDVTVTETRRAGEPPNVKCNQVSARSMEIFRRLGLADRIRNTGLPPEYRNDVAMCVSVLGTELSRIKLPSRAGRVRREKGTDGHWPCAEWGHRINQLHLEPLLFAHAAAQPCIRILNRTQFEEFIQDNNVVTAIAGDLDSGEPVTIRCRYLAGCDGGRSTVRKAIGAELAGIPIYQRVQSTYFRAPKLKSLLRGQPAWMYLAFNPRRCGT